MGKMGKMKSLRNKVFTQEIDIGEHLGLIEANDVKEAVSDLKELIYFIDKFDKEDNIPKEERLNYSDTLTSKEKRSYKLLCNKYNLKYYKNYSKNIIINRIFGDWEK